MHRFETEDGASERGRRRAERHQWFPLRPMGKGEGRTPKRVPSGPRP